MMSKKPIKKRNLEFFRKAAKQLLKRARNHDKKAIDTIVERHPRIDRLGEFNPETFKLADAQYLIAIREGKTSWPALKRSIEKVSNQPKCVSSQQAFGEASLVVDFPSRLRMAA